MALVLALEIPFETLFPICPYRVGTLSGLENITASFIRTRVWKARMAALLVIAVLS